MHRIASAVGVGFGEDGSRCAICIDSPFDTAGPVKQALGPVFALHEHLADPGAGKVCGGCKAVLSGKPGRQPPPLRMVSFRLRPGRHLEFLTHTDWWPIIRSGPEDGEILSWGRSKKKQHMLFAGFSGRGTWRVGSDDGQIIGRHSRMAVEALESLRECGASKAEILLGRYRPQRTAKFGDEIERAENDIRELRHTPYMAWLLWALPSDPIKRNERGNGMALGRHDRIAVNLLAAIAWNSSYRRMEGIQFWDGFFAGRINRFALRPLPDFAASLIAEAKVPAMKAGEAARIVEGMDAADEEATMDAIRKRGAMLLGLVFDEMEARRRLPARMQDLPPPENGYPVEGVFTKGES